MDVYCSNNVLQARRAVEQLRLETALQRVKVRQNNTFTLQLFIIVYMAENDNKKTDFQACSIEYTLLKIHEITLKKKKEKESKWQLLLFSNK